MLPGGVWKTVMSNILHFSWIVSVVFLEQNVYQGVLQGGF